MALPIPPPINRTPREVEAPARGLVPYALAGAFLLGSLILAGVWTSRVLRASQCKEDLAVHLASEDYEGAVASVKKLVEIDTRLRRSHWQSRLAHILGEWARLDLSRGDFQAAAEHAAAAEEAARTARLDEAFTEQLRVISSGSAIGQLDHDWDSLASFDDQSQRCRIVLNRYPGTGAAVRAQELLDAVKADSKAAQERWETVTGTAQDLEMDGHIAEALAEWKDFRQVCDSRDKMHHGQAGDTVARLQRYLADRFYVLKARRTLPAGESLPKAAAPVLQETDRTVLYQLRPGRRDRSDSTEDSVAMALEEGVLYCLSGNTGRMAWALHQGLGMRYRPAKVGADLVCVSHFGKKLSRISPDGRVVWSLGLPLPPVCDPIALRDEEIAILDLAGALRVLDARSGEPRAFRGIAGGVTGLVSDGQYRLAAVGSRRAILFERDADSWSEIGGILLDEQQRERMHVFDQYICLVTMGGKQTTPEKRLHLWRDRRITPISGATIPVAPGDALLDGRARLQLWRSSLGAYCTQVQEARLNDPLSRVATDQLFGMTDGRILDRGGSKYLLAAGSSVQLLRWTPGQPGEFLREEWDRSLRWENGNSPGIVAASPEVLAVSEDSAVVRGLAAHSSIFGAFSISDQGQSLWTARLGPRMSSTPVTMEGQIIWPAGRKGAWVLGQTGLLDYRPSPLEAGSGSLRVISDGEHILFYNDGALRVCDRTLQALWPEATVVEARIQAVLFAGGMVCALTDDEALHCYELGTGRPASAVDGKEELRSRLLAIAKGKRRRPKAGPRGAEISLDRPPEVLWADSNVTIVSREGGTQLACLAGGDAREKWSVSLPATVYWAGPGSEGRLLVVTRPGHCLRISMATGQTVGDVDILPGVPVALPARLGDRLWIPVSGYRVHSIVVGDRMGKGGAGER